MNTDFDFEIFGMKRTTEKLNAIIYNMPNSLTRCGLEKNGFKRLQEEQVGRTVTGLFWTYVSIVMNSDCQKVYQNLSSLKWMYFDSILKWKKSVRASTTTS